MKKKILLIFILAIFGFANKKNCYAVKFNGHITQNGINIANQVVYITDSLTFNHIVFTDSLGIFRDSINYSTFPVNFYISTLNCFNSFSTSIAFCANNNITINIIIIKCNISRDIGVIDIFNPLDTINNIGNLIFPSVKIVNFDTVAISSFPLSYSVNGQNTVIETWNGTSPLQPFDTMYYVFNNGFIPPYSNFSICASTLLNNDVFPNNDSLCKTVIQTSPYIDAGVTDIITPTNQVMVGDIIPLKVKFKNYSTQSINSLQIGFIINGQLLSPFNWVGVLYPDSSAIIQVGTYTVPNQNNLYLISYTNLIGDMNHNNDTCFKTQLIVPPFDAGATEILLPSDTVHLGDTLFPVIKFKNYGSQTITNLQVYFKSHYQLLGPINWTGSLPHDSSATVSIGSFIVLDPFISEILYAYTNLNGDINHFNDSCYKTIIKLSPQYDVGVTSILNPISASIGDTIFPKIKFKNYGYQTITNLNLAYKINGITTIENWIGNLPHDSSTIYTFSQSITCPSSFYMSAFTLLSLDLFTQNDTFNVSFIPNPAQIDVGVVEIISPADVTCSGMQTYPKVVIKNFGITPLTSIPLSCQRGSSTIVTGNWTRLVPLNYGDTVHFTFATFFNVPIGTYYAFSAFTTLANDANPINNKVAKSVIIGIPPPTSFSIVGDDTVIIGQNNVVYYCDIPFSSTTYQYIWTLPPGAVIDTVYNNYIVINYGNNAQSGNITCKIMNACGITQTVVLPISVFATPPPPIIYQSGSTLYSGYSTGNQWYFNNVAISGATQPTYIPANTGYYYCMVTINGSVSYASNSIYVALTGIDDAYIKSHFNVYPNPFTDKTNFNYSLNKSALVNLKITDMEGRLIRTLVNEEQSTGEFSYQLNANNLSKGIYFYQFKAGNISLNGKLIIK